jgi:lysophospholipase L1-like esterase
MSRKNKIIYIAALLCSVIAAIAGAELYVRLFSAYGYWTPEMIRENGKGWDPRYQATVFARSAFEQGGQTILFPDKDPKRGQVMWSLNTMGYRGREFTYTKPDNTIRIVFYGGSQVFDICTHNDEHWPGKVEEALHKAGKNSIEVINAGIPGHSSHDSFGKLFSEGCGWKPDYVILCNAWNDIKDFRFSTGLLRLRKPLQNEQSPFWYYVNPHDKFLCEHSQLFVRLRRRWLAWQYSTGTGLEGEIPAGNIMSDTLCQIPLDQYRLSVEMFIDCARRCGAVPILMTQPRLVVLHNSKEDRKKIMYEYVGLTHEALCRAFAFTDSTIRDVAEKEQVLLIDASAAITGQAPCFADHVHLNAHGSQKLAELVARELDDMLSNRSQVLSR